MVIITEGAVKEAITILKLQAEKLAFTKKCHLIFVVCHHFCAKYLGMTREKFNGHSVSLSAVHLDLIGSSIQTSQGKTA